MAQQPTANTLDVGILGERPQRRLPGALDVGRRLVREKPLGLIGLVIVCIITVAAVASSLSPYGPNELRRSPRPRPCSS